ncbi:hypothetical protein Tsubulata_045298 [Turnera subulata]|uniref:NAC domain-containing protein n=1 Tax=Turnera subulata TaxID=218843 RepID=A0A9Q0G4R6_9ROSI|nr:hypothetical protein Tsubulata_045298 [Turnera subulata]
MDDDVLDGGKWIANSGDKEIFNEEDKKVIIGFKKSLTFFIPPTNKTTKTREKKKTSPKKKDMIKTEWIMHEYTLFGEVFQEWAVCRIKNKAKEPKEDHQQQDEEQQQEGEEDHHQDYTYFEEEALNLQQYQTDNITSLIVPPPIASQDHHQLPLSYNYVDTAPSSANNMHANLAANPQEQQQQQGQEDQAADYTSTLNKDIQCAALEAADSDSAFDFWCHDSKEKNGGDFVDEEELFNMPGLLDSMAEGLILTPPGICTGFSSWDDEENNAVDLNLWVY